ncbi:hypothetical protein L9F63_025428, partial [Diploptera punctata]
TFHKRTQQPREQTLMITIILQAIQLSSFYNFVQHEQKSECIENCTLQLHL